MQCSALQKARRRRSPLECSSEHFRPAALLEAFFPGQNKSQCAAVQGVTLVEALINNPDVHKKLAREAQSLQEPLNFKSLMSLEWTVAFVKECLRYVCVLPRKGNLMSTPGPKPCISSRCILHACAHAANDALLSSHWLTCLLAGASVPQNTNTVYVIFPTLAKWAHVPKIGGTYLAISASSASLKHSRRSVCHQGNSNAAELVERVLYSYFSQSMANWGQKADS